MNKTFLLLLLFIAFFANAQVTRENQSQTNPEANDVSENTAEKVEKIRVVGRVVNGETNEPLPFVHVVNVSARQGATTNEKGEFDFLGNSCDTIVFSSVGFEKFYLIMNSVATSRDLKIEMAIATTELATIEVYAFKDYETFKKEFLALDISDRPEKIDVPGSYYGPRREYKPSVLNPVSFVYNMFDKRAKERVKLVQVQQETERWNQLRRKYDFIKDIADIKDVELEEFLDFCRLDVAWVERSTDYELALAVNRCLTDFKTLKKH